MQFYYGSRAAEYEQIYHRKDPQRQKELQQLAESMKSALLDRDVLEIACGTGYWTKIAAEAARTIVATDITPEVLEIAEAKDLPKEKIRFQIGNAYHASSIPGDFQAGLVNFWFSHVPKASISAFLTELHHKLGPGSVVFMSDNMYVPGIGGELLHIPGDENTYKLRTLSDGSTYEVMKNYYDEKELRQILNPFARNIQIQIETCFWWVSYVVA